MTAEPSTAIAAVLAQLELIDPTAADDARAVIDWLVGEGDLDSLSRYAVQQFCWYELPFKWIVAPVVRREIVTALARFFDLAGLSRYGAVCRSAETDTVLAEWARDPRDGFAAYRRASRDSGVEPPELPELTWSQAMGTDEFDAFWSTAMALELAVDAGVVDPLARGWRARQQQVARAHLEAPREDLLGASWLQSVWTARLADWIEGPVGVPSRARSQLLAPVANALLHAVPPPRGLARSLAPLSWFLDEVAADPDGIALTVKTHLPRAVVQRGVAKFPTWWPDGRPPPRQQDEVAALVLVDDLARQLRIVRRRGRRLQLTRLGAAVRHDPAALWERVASHTTAGSGFDAAVAEVVLAALLVDPWLDLAELMAEAMVALTESGWHDGVEGAPVPRDAVIRSVDRLAATAVTLGWVRRRGRGAAGAGRHLRLTEVGRSTALLALRSRALAPRQLGGRG